MQDPTPQQYAHIFAKYATSQNLSAPSKLIEQIIKRYEHDKRQMRSCEPRDLIERIKDICRYQQQPLELSDKLIGIAWRGYFGNGH